MEKKKMIPKSVFDMEYATNWLREVDFLKGRGIFPEYEKTDKYGIVTYKYKKTPELFLSLMRYYTMVEYEKTLGINKKNKAEESEEKKIAPFVGADRFSGERIANKKNQKNPLEFPMNNTSPIPGAIFVPVSALDQKLKDTLAGGNLSIVPEEIKNSGSNVIPLKAEDDTE